MNNITVKEIVKKYLEEHGYDGLWICWSRGCGCKIDDLMPCGEFSSECEPGYIQCCNKCEDKINDECLFDPDCKWCIGPNKPEVSCE